MTRLVWPKADIFENDGEWPVSPQTLPFPSIAQRGKRLYYT
jgi:hypothetical protein